MTSMEPGTRSGIPDHLSGPDGVYRIGGATSTGVTLDVIEIGAAVRALRLGDRNGAVRNVVLGNHDQSAYESGEEYFGAIVGRYANRLAGGRFLLGASSYTVPANDGQNALHGGPDGFHRRRWTVRNR